MTPTLPPERDLPAGSRARIRRELVDAVNGPRAAGPARASRWLVPATAAAAVVAITGGAVAISALRAGPTPHVPKPAVANAAPHTSPTRAAEEPPLPMPLVPGVTAQRAAEITRGCADSFGVPDADLPEGPNATPSRTPTKPAHHGAPAATPASPTLPPTPTAPSQSPTPDPEATHIGKGSDLRLYNVFTPKGGDRPTRAFILGSELVFSCLLDERPDMLYNPSGGSMVTPLRWLPGDIVMDSNSGGGGTAVVAGRVSARVARIAVSYPGTKPTSYKPVNGTFLVQLSRPPTSTADDLDAVVLAFDAKGNLLGTTGESPYEACYVSPDGDVVIGVAKDKKTCKRATAWP